MATRNKSIEVVITIPNWLERPLVFFMLLYRRIQYGYAFRKIKLTKGKFTIVDPDDYQQLSQYKWHTIKTRNNYYACRTFRGNKQKKKKVLMHREIIDVPANLVVDHINHDGLDNRKVNLRPATISQNGWNSPREKKKGPSQYRGIWWDKKSKKWRAHISFETNRKYLGYFENEKDAARAYDQAAMNYHGEFATLNFEYPKKNKSRLKFLPLSY